MENDTNHTKIPSWFWIAPLFISWRVYMANRMPISDCDEVYNYWEPLHFLLYGSGQQTWEYAHEYALRTYAYIVPLQWLAQWVWQPLLRHTTTTTMTAAVSLLTDAAPPVANNEKLAIFLLLRATLGATTACAELAFWRATRQPVWLLIVLAATAGMNHAAAAYLPSATWMMAWMWAVALYLNEQHAGFVVVAVTATLTVGWPFGVVMMVPMGLSVLWKDFTAKKLVSTLVWTVVVTVVVQGLTMVIDHSHYGAWLSPTLNIFTYNAAGGGDELYGVEPVSFYGKNLLLNLNFAAPLGLLALPSVALLRRGQGSLLVVLSPLVLWLAITVPRPHKEERFLFPIYPLLILGAVLTVDCCIDLLDRAFEKSVSRRRRSMLHALVWIPVVTLSLSRTAALSKYYGAPLTIYATLAQQEQQQQETSLVCTCGEWYRFPSSFYLPQGSQLAFLPSSFHGQLPQPFSVYGSGSASRAVLQPFNDQNLDQPERYEEDPKNCDWIVDLEGSECGRSISSKQEIARVPFLDAEKTVSTLHRTLYIPYLHEQAIAQGKVQYLNYALYKVNHND